MLTADPALKYKRDAQGRSPAHHAAARGNDELLALFLKLRAIEKASLEVELLDKGVPLSSAITSGSVKNTRAKSKSVTTLESIDFLDGFDDDGWTPLAIAIHHGHLGCANQLLAHEADPLAVRKAEKGQQYQGSAVPCAFHLGLLQLYHLNNPDEDAPERKHDDDDAHEDKETTSTDRERRLSLSETSKRRTVTEKSASEKEQHRERSLALAKRSIAAMCDTERVKAYRGVYIAKYLSWAGISYLVKVLLLTYVAIRTSTGFSNANPTYFDQIGQLVPGNDFPGTTGALDTFSYHVQDIDSMWEWVQEVLVDDLIPGDGSGLIDDHNQMVGSIRFRQQRMRQTACGAASPGISTSLLKGPSQMIIEETGVCYSTKAYAHDSIALGDPDGTVSEFERRGVSSSGVRGWFAFGNFRGALPYYQAGHVVDVSPYNRTKAVTLVDAMVDSAWVDDATRVVWIDWTM